jgi:thiol-disulfide isomerase/thioredoxin
MRPIRRRFPAGWLVVAGLFPLGPTTVAADEPRPGADGDRMAAIVAAVRAEEAKYRDIEYVARIVVRDSTRKDPGEPADVTTLATRRVVLQGDRTYLRFQAFERMQGIKARRELISAFDGERTRTVTAGNCANIHLGRFLHPEISPAHGLPLAHYKLNFPLSVYLSGTQAIHAYLQYPREIVETGSPDTFAKVEAHFEGEEPVDGLRCLKVRVGRWYRPNEEPLTQDLWLAPERNYHCIKEKFPWHDMRVSELREVAPGVWFPTKIAVNDYDPQRPGNPVVVKRTETTVETVELAPHHEAGLFRDVAIPADLPVFTIKDRTLVGSTLREPTVGDRASAKLFQLAARVAEQERRYDDIEVKAHVRYKMVDPSLFQWNPLAEQSREDRSIVRGDLAYHTTNQMLFTAAGWQPRLYQADAFDGRWSRRLVGADPRNPQEVGVILRKGRATIDDGQGDGIFVYRPHNLLLRDQSIFSPLADLLASPRFDRSGQTTLRFRHCGTSEVDGHPCIAVRGDFISTRGKEFNSALVMHLATDRNHIPIQQEFFADNLDSRLMPNWLERCDDFREIAPGLWYPFRVTELGFVVGAHMGQGWILLNWRRDYTIDSVTRAPRVDEAVFRDVIAPAGAQVQVRDEDGTNVGVFQQAEAGIPSIATARYLEMLSQVQVGDEEQQARRRAIDALIGKPAPEFPRGAQWLDGEPLTWQALRGRVVILDFWAEWCAPCREDLPQLGRLHRARNANGLTIIGVHPPGSEPPAIRKVMDELHLEYPMCIDVPPREGVKAWGDLFGRFAVQAIPHAVLVDDRGTIVACGPLQDILAKASGLFEKGE